MNLMYYYNVKKVIGVNHLACIDKLLWFNPAGN